jgi:hypothetical protein
MTKKFQSKSGLPEALGSSAHIHEQTRPKKVSEEMCYIPGCLSIRTNRDQTMPDGSVERIYEQGKSDIVIKSKDGTVHGYVCQYHYQKMLDEAGKDQLSCVRTEGISAPQQELPVTERAPAGLVDHLRQIEDQIAEQWSQLHDD